MKIYKGNIVFTSSPEKFDVYENHHIVVKDGKVVEIIKDLPINYEQDQVIDFGENLIIPGFVDMHFHAPQFFNIGLGLDKELLPWLEEYTFPEEAKFKSIDYAKKVYREVAKNLWKHGTTRSVLFGSLHKESTMELLDIMGKSGLGAYVGKVNMDRNSPEFLIECSKKSVFDTEEIINNYANKYELVKPIVTPRFVPSCTKELMNDLGEISKKYNLPVQTHISENKDEIKWVQELHPESSNYLDVYDQCQLLETKAILAHCIHSTKEEIEVMKKKDLYIAHCPNANYNLASGMMPIKKYIDEGIKVGLGSDVGAGHQTAIYSVIVAAIQTSKMKWLENDKHKPLTISEGFYMGTKGGGSFFGNVGSFEPGFEFDALVIDDSKLISIEDKTIEERIQRFVYVGDDRNIVKRFVCGKEIEEPKF